MSVAQALETVYSKISGVLTMINSVLADKMITEANTFYDIPERIAEIVGADPVIDGTVSAMVSKALVVQAYKFYGCDLLQRISLPLATHIYDYAFAGCSSLTEVNAPSATFLGMRAFSNSGLINADFPMVSSTGGNAFFDSAALTTATLPSLNIVESGVFYNCRGLRRVDLTNVRSISVNAFTGCTSLEALIIRKAGVCALSSVKAFDNSKIQTGGGYIYVPQQYYGSYLNATNWTVFRNRIRPIESYTHIIGNS